MKVDMLAVGPVTWLSAAPSPVPPKDIATIMASFASPPNVCRLTGPGELIRAAGRNAKGEQVRAYGGGYWIEVEALARIDANLSQYSGWLSENILQESRRKIYRSGSAICEDWNDFSEFCKMIIPSEECVEALRGQIREQPQKSSLDPRQRSTPMLPGGFTQIFLKIRNPLWIFMTAPL